MNVQFQCRIYSGELLYVQMVSDLLHFMQDSSASDAVIVGWHIVLCLSVPVWK